MIQSEIWFDSEFPYRIVLYTINLFITFGNSQAKHNIEQAIN